MDTSMTTQSENKQQKRKGGRPALLPQERRRNQITIGFTDSQIDKLIDRAEAAGLTEVELVRRLALNLEFKTIPMANKDAVIELTRIGRNVNQIAKKLSQGLLIGLSADKVEAWMKVTSEELNSVGKRLVGGDHGDK